MLIKGLQKHTLLDYPGKIACTIFVFGCNFQCGYCHNPELVKAELAKKVKTYSEQEILDFLTERIDFLEGVCITGGEPTLNPDLPGFIKKIKQLGYKVKVDTNGTNPEMLEKLLKNKLADYIAMDIKAPFRKYEQVVKARVKIENLKKSIDIIKRFPEYEFRITIVPGLINKDDLIEIAEYLKKNKANKAFYLQGFRNKICLNKKFEKIKPYSKQDMQKFYEAIKGYFKKCEIRNKIY
jgi:pyruvate formate lyase activating enzyme